MMRRPIVDFGDLGNRKGLRGAQCLDDELLRVVAGRKRLECGGRDSGSRFFIGI